jgi:protein phosphatase 1 regulatory subunit 7
MEQDGLAPQVLAGGSDREDAERAADVPLPPQQGSGRSERRAHVVLPEEVPDDGPTYYRIGVDHLYDPGQEEIHFQCTRIQKLENLEPAGADLKTLCLIANCIEKIENLEANTGLEHLELYQNLIKKIDNIRHLTNLTVLDFSFNRIRSTEYLGTCFFEKLEKLYLSSNKIEEAKGLCHFVNLKMLELGANRIRTLPADLGNLLNLQELWLGKNKIGSMALPPLPHLKHLSMQNNRLETWDGALFANCPRLTHLYLGHNNLPDMPPEFGMLGELQELDLAKNAIRSITPIPQLQSLKDLWMNDNQVEDLEEVRNLAAFPSLQAIYLERNPMHGLGDKAMEKRYQDAILAAVPWITQLDAIHLQESVKIITDGSEKRVLGIRKN